jgi:hypothetical protein
VYQIPTPRLCTIYAGPRLVLSDLINVDTAHRPYHQPLWFPRDDLTPLTITDNSTSTYTILANWIVYMAEHSSKEFENAINGVQVFLVPPAATSEVDAICFLRWIRQSISGWPRRKWGYSKFQNSVSKSERSTPCWR